MAFSGMVKFNKTEADKKYQQGGYTDNTEAFFEQEAQKYDQTYEWKPLGQKKGPSYSKQFHNYAISRLGHGFTYRQVCNKFNISLMQAKVWVNEFGAEEGYTHEVVNGKLRFTAC